MLDESSQHRVSGLIHQYAFLLSTLIMLFQLNSTQILFTDVLFSCLHRAATVSK